MSTGASQGSVTQTPVSAASHTGQRSATWSRTPFGCADVRDNRAVASVDVRVIVITTRHCDASPQNRASMLDWSHPVAILYHVGAPAKVAGAAQHVYLCGLFFF